MDWSADCAVVIPCLNEARSIAALVTAVRRYLPQVIVVDDGSSDDTAKLAEGAGAEVVRHSRSWGKGAALDTGWVRAMERGFAWALTLDGDGQHSPDDIPEFLTAAVGGGVDLVVGNRMANPGKMPWLRRKVNLWMSKKISDAAGMLMPDSQCGFRLMRLSAWSSLDLETSGFEIESEVLLEFIVRGYQVRFVPIETVYKNERSKIHPLRDTVRWFRWWWRARRKAVRARR